MDDGLEAATYLWYIWDCPVCGETQEADPPDVDPSGDVQECRSCGRSVTITSAGVI